MPDAFAASRPWGGPTECRINIPREESRVREERKDREQFLSHVLEEKKDYESPVVKRYSPLEHVRQWVDKSSELVF